MQKPDHADALEILGVMARARPEPVDLTLEAWVLGYSEARMDAAVAVLLEQHLAEVADAHGASRQFTRQARLTHQGVGLARALGIAVVEPQSDRRRRRRDRRDASAPPPTGTERRHALRDRRSARP